MKTETNKTRIVTQTLQRCVDCGWSHAPAVLAYSYVTRSAGFYCLDCYEITSRLGHLDAQAPHHPS